MRASDIVGFAGRAILGHRLRSTLSLIGMSIGVAAVVVLTGLGEGARLYVVNQFSSIGSNLLIMIPGRTETTGLVPGVSGVPNDLTLDDARALLRSVPEIVQAAPVVVATDNVSYRERRRQVAVMGATAELIQVQDFTVSRGRFLPEEEWDRGSQVVVLGSETASELFENEDPIGRRVRIGDSRALVIGVLESRGTQVGVDFDDIAIIPVATAMRLFNRSSLFRVVLEVRAPSELDTAKEKAIAIIVERHGEEDVTLLTQEAVVSTLSAILGTLTLVVAAIAAVSLSVAGIGIMNVMLVSVSERTSEVGLLKALGAKKRDILLAFLVEAALLSVAGAVVGLVLGLIMVQVVVALYPNFPATAPWWILTASMLVALGFGVGFGVLPARRATGLDPIEALARH